MNAREHERIGELLSAWIDGELPEAEAERVASHVETCAECARAADAVRRVVAVAAKIRPAEPPRDFSRAVLARVSPATSPRHRFALAPSMLLLFLAFTAAVAWKVHPGLFGRPPARTLSDFAAHPVETVTGRELPPASAPSPLADGNSFALTQQVAGGESGASSEAAPEPSPAVAKEETRAKAKGEIAGVLRARPKSEAPSLAASPAETKAVASRGEPSPAGAGAGPASKAARTADGDGALPESAADPVADAFLEPAAQDGELAASLADAQDAAAAEAGKADSPRDADAQAAGAAPAIRDLAKKEARATAAPPEPLRARRGAPAVEMESVVASAPARSGASAFEPKMEFVLRVDAECLTGVVTLVNERRMTSYLQTMAGARYEIQLNARPEEATALFSTLGERYRTADAIENGVIVKEIRRK